MDTTTINTNQSNNDSTNTIEQDTNNVPTNESIQQDETNIFQQDDNTSRQESTQHVDNDTSRQDTVQQPTQPQILTTHPLKLLNFEEAYELIHKLTYHNFSKRSTALDILAIYMKGQKILYTEAKTYCEQKLN